MKRTMKRIMQKTGRRDLQPMDSGLSAARPARLFRSRSVRAFAALLVVASSALVPSAPGRARPAVLADGVVASIVPPLGSPHPRVPGMFFFGEYGWGRLTFEAQPPRPTTILMTTPWYSDATSRSRIGWAQPLLGYPIVARTSPQVPDVVDGIVQGCRYVERPSGRIVGYDNAPCEHRNKWARGPQDAFSYCIYKRCQSTGHGNQGGWSTFLAHSELWARVEMVTPPPAIGFVPCGTPCDDSPTATTTPATSIPTPDDGTGDPRDGDGTDPCTLPGVDCANEVCDASGRCAPRCGTTACPPPSVCETDPEHPSCVIEGGALDDVYARVVLDAPEVFITRGVLEPQSVKVVEVSLRCGDRACPSSRLDLDTSSLSVTGPLVLASLSAGYRECRTSSVNACEFRVTAKDATDAVAVGDRVTAVFFTPTRTGEWLRIFLDDPRAEIDVLALLPARVWEETSEGFRLRETGGTSWQYAATVEIPLVVTVRTGTSEGKRYDTSPGREGLRRLVIGTVGRN